MGLNKTWLALLLDEARRHPFAGNLLTFGKQTVYSAREEIMEVLFEFGVERQKLTALSPTGITDVDIFMAVGFERVESIDFSDWQGATHVFDLNDRELPGKLKGRYDVLFDGGTMEHIFHIPNVLANINDMLKVGGRIVHASPSSNYADHGFYMFSPRLFVEYYHANGFTIESVKFCRTSYKKLEIYDYSPRLLKGKHTGGLDGKAYGTFFVATKTKHSRCDVIPQQASYKWAWTGTLAKRVNWETPRRFPSNLGGSGHASRVQLLSQSSAMSFMKPALVKTCNFIYWWNVRWLKYISWLYYRNPFREKPTRIYR